MRNITILLCGLCLIGGCSRTFWKDQADEDSYSAIAERLDDERWAVPRLEVTPHPLSRFAEQGDPASPPLPPDDPAANRYMQRLNGMNGYKSWHKLGTALSVENPQWLASIDMAPDAMADPGNTSRGEEFLKKVTLPEALELANIHSREYQTQIETLYLSSLTLTLQRFQFDVRYLGIGGGEPGGTFTNNVRPSGPRSSTLASRFGVRRFLPSGGQIAAELANNTLWLFTSPGQTSSLSTLSFSLTQPLLFAAGRKIVLESLTQAERDVLYATRDLARFRRVFFSSTVSGGNGYLSLIQRRQFVLNQKANVERLIEQLERLQFESSRRPRVVEQTYGVPTGLLIEDLPEILTGAVTESTGRLRYDPESQELVWTGPVSDEQEEALLQLVPESRFTEIEAVRERWLSEALAGELGGVTSRLEAFSGSIDRARPAYFRKAIEEIISQVRTATESESGTLAVIQLRTQLANARQSLRAAEVQYQDTLDRFKLQIGLPTDFPIAIDEALLEPFELIDPVLTRLEDDLIEFAPVIFSVTDDSPDSATLQQIVSDLVGLQKRLSSEAFSRVNADFDRALQIVPDALGDDDSDNDGGRIPIPGDQQTPAPPDSTLGGVREIDSDTERQRVSSDIRNDRKLLQTLQSEYSRDFYHDFASVTQRMARLQERAAVDSLTANQILSLRSEVAALREVMLRLTRNLQVIQTDLRVELLPLRKFELGIEETVSLALENRVDLMNERAGVMDARRAVEVAANRLQATLNITADGNVRTSGNGNPVDFRGDQSDFRLGLQFTAPLDRVAQRNTYRQALITYQRARRDLIALEDSIRFDVRSAWRQLEVLRTNFETARQAVRAAARQYDIAVENTAQASGNAGLNLLNALSSLLNAQNNLISIFVNYERNRIAIYRDMGLMRIDAEGVWVDEFYQELKSQHHGIRHGLPDIHPQNLTGNGIRESELVSEPNILHNHISDDLFGNEAIRIPLRAPDEFSGDLHLPVATVVEDEHDLVTGHHVTRQKQLDAGSVEGQSVGIPVLMPSLKAPSSDHQLPLHQYSEDSSEPVQPIGFERTTPENAAHEPEAEILHRDPSRPPQRDHLQKPLLKSTDSPAPHQPNRDHRRVLELSDERTFVPGSLLPIVERTSKSPIQASPVTPAGETRQSGPALVSDSGDRSTPAAEHDRAQDEHRESAINADDPRFRLPVSSSVGAERGTDRGGRRRSVVSDRPRKQPGK